jgi:hypothetical protein
MNLGRAMQKINVQAMDYEPKFQGSGASSCPYEEALGFLSSCPGEAALAHYSLVPMTDMEDTRSRNSCARYIAGKLGLSCVKRIEAEIEVFVNRHELEKAQAINLIRQEVYELLSQWEVNWQRALSGCDSLE